MTAVGTYIALSPSEGAGHGHDDHGDHGKGHGDHAEEPKEESKDEPEPEPEAKEESSEKAEAKDEDKPAEEEKPAKEESKDEGKSDKEEDKKEDDSASSEESKDDTKASDDAGAKGESQKGNEISISGTDKVVVKSSGPDDIAKLHKGATKNKDDVKHREEDSGKGSTKVRLDSPAGKTIGEGASSGDGDAQAKTQRGVSNTDTKHSSDPHADPGKSSKGEGTAETAKIKGTVKPDRPQV